MNQTFTKTKLLKGFECQFYSYSNRGLQWLCNQLGPDKHLSFPLACWLEVTDSQAPCTCALHNGGDLPRNYARNGVGLCNTFAQLKGIVKGIGNK